MSAARDDDIQRTLGRLEEGVERLTSTFEKFEEKTSAHRGETRHKLDEISDKVDPVLVKVDALEMTVRAHEVILKSFTDRDIALGGAIRLGQWLTHALWVSASGLAFWYSDKIKTLFSIFSK